MRRRATKNRSAYPFLLLFLFLSDGVGVGVGVELLLPETPPTRFTGTFDFGVVGCWIMTDFDVTMGKCERAAPEPLPLPLPEQSFGPPGPQSCEVVVAIWVWPSGRKVVHTVTVFVHASPVEVHLLVVVVLQTGSAAMPIPAARPKAAVIIIKPNLLFIMTMSNTSPSTLGKREQTRSNN